MAALQNEIYIGSVAAPIYRFTNNAIALSSPQGIFSVDIVGNELSIDTFSFSVRFDFTAENLIYSPVKKTGYRTSDGKIYRLARSGVAQYLSFVPSGSDALVDSNGKYFQTFAGYIPGDFLSNLVFGTPVFWYVAGKFFAKGYVKTVDRTEKSVWKITCVSGIGLLDSTIHVGGIYEGAKFGDIAKSIIGNAFKFSCEAAVADIAIYGHLPYDTARNNLHQLLFAVGASVERGSSTNDYVICFLRTVTTSVPPSRVSINGSVQTQLPSNAVEITEHSYSQVASAEPVVLFDNTEGSVASAQNTTVLFDAPMFDLTWPDSNTPFTGESNCNYAVISGVGVLSGKPYLHTERIVSINEAALGAVRMKRVTDNHLVSFANSNAVAHRVFDYYKAAKTLKAKIMLDGEKCGQNLDMIDAFGEASTAFLSKMTVMPTSVIGASCELIEGFTPKDYGNTFTNRAFITAAGTWTVPDGVTFIRIVLIGGGNGGAGGYDGEDGAYKIKEDPIWGGDPNGELTLDYDVLTDAISIYYANGDQRIPAGGAVGDPGSGGKVLIVDKTVTPGEIITFSLGSGGNGGARNGAAGADGGATTATSTSIGSISSANGISTDVGYHDPMTGEDFALLGSDGVIGGEGGRVDADSLIGNNGKNGLPGGSVGNNSGGAGGVGMTLSSDRKASGGGGGGAAYGANGNPGGAASTSGSTLNVGVGGNGADAQAPAQAIYGNGGTGGNGGGGGGNHGGVVGYDHTMYYDDRAGTGGKGSVGGKGGNGCVIIYY